MNNYNYSIFFEDLKKYCSPLGDDNSLSPMKYAQVIEQLRMAEEELAVIQLAEHDLAAWKITAEKKLTELRSLIVRVEKVEIPAKAKATGSKAAKPITVNNELLKMLGGL